MTELIWAIKTKDIQKFEGFKQDKTGEFYNFLSKKGLFLPRTFLENNSDYKQVIPQGLIVNENKVLLNKRLPGQNENRLNNTISLGFGGHLNPEDNILPHMDLIHIGLHRELAEEITLPLSCEWCNIEELNKFENKFESWAKYIYTKILQR